MAIEMAFTNGELLRKAREDAGLDQRELAVRVGVSRETICRWERDKRDPSARQLKAVERATGANWLWTHIRPNVKPLDLRICVGVNR